MKKVKKVISTFKFGEFNIRIVEIDQEIWFVLKDVGDCLKMRGGNLVRGLDEDEYIQSHYENVNLGCNRGMLLVNESGFYKSVFRSRKPEAKMFTRWITKEVIPQIRRVREYQQLLEQKRLAGLASTFEEAYNKEHRLLIKVCEGLKAQSDFETQELEESKNVSHLLNEYSIYLEKNNIKVNQTESPKEYVYLLEANNYVKIGRTINRKDRIKSLVNSGNLEDFKVSFYETDNATSLELHLHGVFYRDRRRGEWFSTDPENIRDYLLNLSNFKIKETHHRIEECSLEDLE